MEIVRCCGIVCILILAGLKDLSGFWKAGSKQKILPHAAGFNMSYKRFSLL